MGHRETWTSLLSCHTDFSHLAWPILCGQSLKWVHTCPTVYLHLQHSSASAGETRLSSFMVFEVWPSGSVSLLSPPPPRPCPIPATQRTHLKEFAFRADTRRWLARWKRSASGLPYQWRQCCVTHRERTSCSTTLLLFLLQTAAIALSSFFSPPLHFCFCRCEKEVWGCPVVHTFRQLCPPLNAPRIIPRFHFCCLFFSWFSLVTDIDTCSVAIMDLVIRIRCLWG